MQQVQTRIIHPRQLAFITATDRQLLMYGGRGGGKTRALCERAFHRARHPRAVEALCRSTNTRLSATTLKELLEGSGNSPPVLPYGSYAHNQKKQTIQIKGGGQIVYFGLDDPERATSFNLTGAGIEEVTEVRAEAYDRLSESVRVPVEGLPISTYGVCNPHLPSHHIAKRFGLGGGNIARRGHRSIFINADHNRANLAPGYIEETLDTLTGLAYKRYRLGQWVGSDGLVYDTFNRLVHVAERSGPWKRTIIGIDEGYTNPFVALVGRIDGDGRLHIEAEHYQSKMVRDDKVSAVRGLADGAESVMVDPSAAELIETLRAAGVPSKPANNDIDGGCHRVRARLADPGDGLPRLTVDPSCENLIREFESYEYKPDTDKPKKEFDHAMDALRYLVAEADGPGFSAQVISYRDEPEERSVTLTGDYGWQTM